MSARHVEGVSLALVADDALLLDRADRGVLLLQRAVHLYFEGGHAPDLEPIAVLDLELLAYGALLGQASPGPN